MLNFLKKDELAQIEQKTNAIADLNQKNTDLEQTISSLSQELEELKKKQERELSDAKKTIHDLELDLQQQQARLEAVNAKRELDLTEANQKLQDLEESILEQQTELESMVPETKLKQALSQLEQLKQGGERAAKEHQQLLEKFQNLDVSSKATEQDRQDIIKDRQRLWEEYQKLEVSRNQHRDKAEKLERDYNSFNERFGSLENELTKDNKHILRNESLLKENHFLLIQVRQTQDELTQLQEAYEKLVNLNDSINLKWKRLEKRIPDYIDYGGLELVQVDTVGLTPQITWKITDYSRAGVALSEFLFVTTFYDGHVGIAIKTKNDEEELISFIPALVESSLEQREMFFTFTQVTWERIRAASAVMEHSLLGKNLMLTGSPDGFDIGFWKGSLQSLVINLKKLPEILRYEGVKLKRELVNADYEHLWLELYGLHYGGKKLDKFEIRVGASLVEANGFSRFPKFEIPLVDGKIKPFDSWYAESHDDQGPKFELRFALDMGAFDIGSWLKLSIDDQKLLQFVLFRIPIILNTLSKNNLSIRRPWSQWIAFVNAALAIMQEQFSPTQKQERTAQVAKEVDQDAGAVSQGLDKSLPTKGNKKSSVTVVSSKSKNSEVQTNKLPKNQSTSESNPPKKNSIKKSLGR